MEAEGKVIVWNLFNNFVKKVALEKFTFWKFWLAWLFAKEGRRDKNLRRRMAFVTVAINTATDTMATIISEEDHHHYSNHKNNQKSKREKKGDKMAGNRKENKRI